MNSERRPQAILLDALGTLIGIRPPSQRLVDLLARRHGVVVALDDAVRGLRAEMTYYRTHCRHAADAESLALLRRMCAGVLARELGGPITTLDSTELAQTLVDALEFAPYPDTVDALRRLRAEGARLVVVSNWDISLHEVLGRTALLGLLDGVVCSAAVGSAKPAAAIFEAGLELAGVARERALHVGDSFAEDVLGARAAGIAPVLILRPPAACDGLIAASHEAHPDDVATIASLAELPRRGADG